jgi:hypothetical protein
VLSVDDHDPWRDFADAETVDGSPTRSGFRVPATPPSGGRRYLVGPELARGGLGRVATALDRTLQRRVAIKELRVRTAAGRRRFVREALTTARLQHPAIIPVLDAGAWDSGDPFLVLRLLDGKTLADELVARDSTEARLALVPSLLAIADALGYAHAQRVIHRDVKPSNIMLGPHGEAVLLDWGVAYDESASELEIEGLGRGPEPHGRGSSERLTQVGAIAGTVRYMSPEQARGERPTPAFDVYSLGATIANVLSGQTPFGDLAHDEIVAKLRAGITSIPALPAEVPPDLAAIVTKATAPRAERYPHAGLLADDLRKLIAGQLVSARRYTRGQLLARWARRNRVLLATASAALVAIGLIAAFAVRSVIHERNTAVARQQELLLAQARSSVRSDPTTALAWLKAYPRDAPHQDEVRELLDQAAGRGVASHVWRDDAVVAEAAFVPGGLIAALRDGTVMRGDLASGDVRLVGKLGDAPAFTRAHDADVFLLDLEGGIARWSGETLTRLTQISLGSRPSGLFYVPELDELKVTYPDEPPTWVGLGRAAQRHPDPTTLGDVLYADEETNARAIYAVLADGTLTYLDPDPGQLWQFSPHTWIRGSEDGKRYLAVEPTATGVTLWTGTAYGGAPIELARARPCRSGEDRQELAEITNDGRVVVSLRCGELAAYETTTRHQIPIDAPDRILMFQLAPSGRWLAAGRADGLDLVEIATGQVRPLLGGSPVVLVGFSRDERWMYSFGPEQGLRAWLIDPGPPHARLGDAWTPSRLALTTTESEVAVLRHLECATWRSSEPDLVTRAAVTLPDLPPADDDQLLWPWSVSDDGRTCVFARQDEGALVVSGRTTIALSDPDGIVDCVLDRDGKTAFCLTGSKVLATFDLATGARHDVRLAGAAPIALVRYRGKAIALVEHDDGCALVDFANHQLARLPGGRGCRFAQASNLVQPGLETGITIERPDGVQIWTEAGTTTLRTAAKSVEISPDGRLVAAAQGEAVEIYDARTGARRAGPPVHDRMIVDFAWSGGGVLAAADEETIWLWDPATGLSRAMYAPRVSAMVWARDGKSLYTTDGRQVTAWPIDLAAGASPADVRARLEMLTTARIVDGRARTVP